MLVVLGHMDIPVYIRGMIFSYHMPFFFIANAYFIKNYNLREHLIKSGKSLLIPYGIICVLSAVLCVNRNSGEFPNYKIFLNRTMDMFAGMSKITGHFTKFESVWLVWFVICLFAARVIYVILMKWLKNAPKWFSLLIMVILAGIGEAIGLFYAFLPWSLDVALVALPLMWIGDELHKTSWISQNERHMWIWAICLFVWIFLGWNKFIIEMATRSYPGYMICLIEAIAGSMVWIRFSILIERKCKQLSSFLAWCGRHSMVILALHCLEMRFFDWDTLIYSSIPFNVTWMSGFVITISVILIVAWIIVQIQEGIHFLNLSN